MLHRLFCVTWEFTACRGLATGTLYKYVCICKPFSGATLHAYKKYHLKFPLLYQLLERCFYLTTSLVCLRETAYLLLCSSVPLQKKNNFVAPNTFSVSVISRGVIPRAASFRTHLLERKKKVLTFALCWFVSLIIWWAFRETQLHLRRLQQELSPLWHDYSIIIVSLFLFCFSLTNMNSACSYKSSTSRPYLPIIKLLEPG